MLVVSVLDWGNVGGVLCLGVMGFGLVGGFVLMWVFGGSCVSWWELDAVGEVVLCCWWMGLFLVGGLYWGCCVVVEFWGRYGFFAWIL